MWVVVQVKPNEHAIAARNLRQQNFEVFAPMVHTRTRRTLRSNLMFSGYIFANIDPSRAPHWSAVNGTRGVIRVITMASGKPAILPEGWVRDLRLQGDSYMRPSETNSLKRGDMVEFIAGPFKGARGTCQEINKKSISLLFSLLGEEKQISSSPELLRKVE